MKFHKSFILVVLFLASFNLFAQPIKWAVVAPGVWKGIVGKPEAYNLLTASGSKPNTRSS